MPTSYHRFAGKSLGRLAALSDGVFAVAMTLLVLDLKPPSVPPRTQRAIWSGGGGSEHALLHGLPHRMCLYVIAAHGSSEAALTSTSCSPSASVGSGTSGAAVRRRRPSHQPVRRPLKAVR